MRRDAIFINRASSIPLHRQLETAIREAIFNGVLKPGERMLSSRELRMHLGVSRTTVTEALDRLEADGLVVTRRGAGTFVSSSIREPVKERATQPAETVVPSDQALHFIAAQRMNANAAGGVAFRPGLPALDSFPLVQFRACIKASDWMGDSYDYPAGSGLPSLREAIANRLRLTRGVACSPEQILVTSGAQAAFALIFRALLQSRDPVAVEDPCYPNVLSLLRSHSAKIVPIPVDDDGLQVEALYGTQAKCVYITPSHQYPTGAVLPLSRRIDLLDWATLNDAWIIEDDYDSEFNYSGQAHPALQGLDETHRVLYVGTFSKVLSPALRIAYVVVPDGLMAAFEAVHEITGAGPSSPLQAALARFIERGHLGRHISKMRKIYDERRKATSRYLTAPRGSPFKVRDSQSGLHFIAELPAAVPDVAVSELAASAGVALRPLSGYYLGEPRLNAVMVGFAATPPAAARTAINTFMKQVIDLPK